MGCVQSKPTAKRKGLMSQHEDVVANNNVQVGSYILSSLAMTPCELSCLSKKNFELAEIKPELFPGRQSSPSSRCNFSSSSE